MNHPTPETWMSYLYGETGREERHRLRSHLSGCVECRQQFETWQHSSKNLDEWPVGSFARPRYNVALRWAMAACLVLGLGFSAGRLTLPTVQQIDQAALKVELERTVRAEIAQSREADRNQWKVLLTNLQKQHTDDYAVLRKDLETVAVLAEANLRRTQQEIGQLAAYSRTATSNP